ncbi:hypothetical protein QBC45DRAFT_402345 [Copromyces sp. CBS 386.78]|nr:hypothetical protein QBC45DRAFT_402345 [Copromyces sp. CBS 386.78]
MTVCVACVCVLFCVAAAPEARFVARTSEGHLVVFLCWAVPVVCSLAGLPESRLPQPLLLRPQNFIPTSFGYHLPVLVPSFPLNDTITRTSRNGQSRLNDETSTLIHRNDEP